MANYGSGWTATQNDTYLADALRYAQMAKQAQTAGAAAAQSMDMDMKLKMIEQMLGKKAAEEIIHRPGTKFVKEVETDPMEAAIQRATEIMKQGG